MIAPMRDAVARQRQIGIPLQQVAQSRMYLAGALMYINQKADAVAEADATLTELGEKSTPCGRGIVSVQLQIGTIFRRLEDHRSR